MKRLFPLVLFLAAFTAFAADPQPVHVFVVGTTDLHGSYDSHPASKNAPAYGGLPLLAADRIKIDYSRPIRELLIDALKAMPQPMSPKVDGRITVLNPVGTGD